MESKRVMKPHYTEDSEAEENKHSSPSPAKDYPDTPLNPPKVKIIVHQLVNSNSTVLSDSRMEPIVPSKQMMSA